MFFEWSSTKHIILVQLFNLTGCHGNRNVNLRQNIKQKINCSEAIRVIKLNRCRKLFIIVNKNIVFSPLLKYCRYFDESILEMFVEWSFTKHISLVQTSYIDWLPWRPKG